jgi:hypothetical protein
VCVCTKGTRDPVRTLPLLCQVTTLHRLACDTLKPCHAACAKAFIFLRVAGTWTVGWIVPERWGLTLLHAFHACHSFKAPLRQIAPQVVRPVPRQHRQPLHAPRAKASL